MINNEPFMLTYGDGVADININKLVQEHKAGQKLITMTSVQPEGRFGALDIAEGNVVTSFREKPKGDGSWINGGFFVLNPKVFQYLEGNMNDMMWEDEPLEKLTNDHQLVAYQHRGFWKCMDALRDKIELEDLWKNHNAKWKVW